MDEVAVVRHRVLVEGASAREVALALGISRNTVRRYVEGAPAGVRRPSPRERPALQRAQARMDALLTEAPKWTAGKQRLTATQLSGERRLEDEEWGGMLGSCDDLSWRGTTACELLEVERPPLLVRGMKAIFSGPV